MIVYYLSAGYREETIVVILKFNAIFLAVRLQIKPVLIFTMLKTILFIRCFIRIFIIPTRSGKLLY